MRERPWIEKANCLTEDPDLFFPGQTEHVKLAKAKLVCGECAVREECLKWAFDSDQRFGVLGGMSEQERERITRRRRRIG